MKAYLAALCAGAALAAMPAAAQSIVTERSVAAHEAFLASDALQGRGSATRDEAIAAAYVASQFQSFGLVPAPGMDGYLMIRKVKLHILKKFFGVRRHGKATVITDVCTKMNRPLFFVNVYTNV